MFEFLRNMMNLLPQFLGNYKEDSNIYKYLKAFADEMDELKQTFDQIIVIRDIDQATGIYLDLIGVNLNLPRGSLDDESYRTNLKVEILANKSNGEIEVIRQVAELVYNTDIGLREMYDDAVYLNEPAGLVMQVVGDLNAITVPSAAVLKSLSGGVRLATELKLTNEIIEIQEPTGNLFEIINIRSGTFVIAKTMGNLF